MPSDVRLIHSPTSVIGMVLTTISAVLFVVVFLADLLGLYTNPYIGIIFFLVLPAIFIIGLILIPLGAWIERRRRAAGKPPSGIEWPRVDLNNPSHRTTAVIVFALTMANIVIVSLAAYRGVEYMDSVQFCGQVCHTAMKPEFVAHEQGPHARVACVQCHVGPGARSFARSKLAGTRRVAAVVFQNHPRPIVAAPEQLISARDACENCHWPTQPHGDKIRRVVEYADDEKNTESATTLRLHVGGGNGRRGAATGIHWHVTNEIEYVATDRDRQAIAYVRAADRDGSVREYVMDGSSPDQFANAIRRRMDCTDCHNRPSHSIATSAERAVNEAMVQGNILKTLPFVHREAVKALKQAYPTQGVAVSEIAQSLRGFFQAHAGVQGSDLEKAVSSVQDIYRRNVFPEMNVQFGTYPNNIGHVESPGCFRCHDDNHKSKDGRPIGQDCETCHAIE
jgi:hypothetical protein